MFNKVIQNLIIIKFLWILWLKQVGFLDNTPIFITLAAQQIYRWIKKTVERVHYYKF